MMNRPIIHSILDTDAYKLHMQQAAFLLYPNTTVEAEFICRDANQLGYLVPAINDQIEYLSRLSLTNEEFDYLRSLPFFNLEYLNWLKQFRFKPETVKIANHSGSLAITLSGSWLNVILWEVPLLAIISELAHLSSNIISEEKLPTILTSHIDSILQPLTDYQNKPALENFQLAEFGTRRRYSYLTQKIVIEKLNESFNAVSNNTKKLGKFVGTSNYHFAQKFGLPAIGTQAHEWFQTHQQLSHSLDQFQRLALTNWLEVYPNSLGIALTDCLNMKAFLRDFDEELANRYQGIRHDSGDPIRWGEQAIKHYEECNIDPKTKTLVFSDSLTIEKAITLYERFHTRTQVLFGIGTHLTCNLPNIKPINMVIKVTKCNDHPVAKLSDTPGKTICKDTDFILRLKETFAITV